MAEANSEVSAMFTAIEHLAATEVVSVARGTSDEARMLVIPKTKQVLDLKSYLDTRREHPERRTGTARMTTVESFVDHVKRFADEHTVVFACDEAKDPLLEAVLDYHRTGSTGTPAWCAHRTLYRFPLSDEWYAWTSEPLTFDQRAFAEFLEDRIADVLDPAEAGEQVTAFAANLGIALASPPALLGLSRGLSVHVDQKVVQHINIASGEVQLQFEEQHQTPGGGQLKVPGGFAIGVPVFRGGAYYSLAVRLRYRISGGAVKWTLLPMRADLVFRDAINTAIKQVSDALGLPVLRGRPEGTP
jgi:uncharacterized protein YfdQ (DUF2303 family)